MILQAFLSLYFGRGIFAFLDISHHCFSFSLSFMPSTNTRPPISGLKRPSLAAGTSFEALYTASYVAPNTCIKRSTSDTFIVHRAREQQQRARQEEMALLAQNQHDQVDMLTLWQLLCLTICMAGVQFTCNTMISAA